jgi:transposase-like protein
MSTLAELSKLTEDQAREYLEHIRWPSGPVCPHCGVIGNATKFAAGGKARPGVWKCKSCRKQFSVTVNTIFERSHIELRLWLMAFAIMRVQERWCRPYSSSASSGSALISPHGTWRTAFVTQ